MIKALSIQQPWAWLIAQGHKDIENRTWPTVYRGPVLIHAGKRLDPQTEQIRWVVQRQFGILIPAALDLGGIVGIASVEDCVQQSASPWFSGPYGFVLKDARPLPFTPCRGLLGFYVPGPEVLKALESDIAAYLRRR